MENIERNRVLEFVKATIRDYAGSDAQDMTLSEETNPIRDLGLDSMDGVDFAVAIGTKFKVRIPDEINPLVDNKVNVGRNLGQIVDLIKSLSMEANA